MGVNPHTVGGDSGGHFGLRNFLLNIYSQKLCFYFQVQYYRVYSNDNVITIFFEKLPKLTKNVILFFNKILMMKDVLKSLKSSQLIIRVGSLKVSNPDSAGLRRFLWDLNFVFSNHQKLPFRYHGAIELPLSVSRMSDNVRSTLFRAALRRLTENNPSRYQWTRPGIE